MTRDKCSLSFVCILLLQQGSCADVDEHRKRARQLEFVTAVLGNTTYYFKLYLAQRRVRRDQSEELYVNDFV